MDNRKCKHCGGRIEIRNPSGHCDHLMWPDCLTDEAKIANGFIKKTVEMWRKPAKDSRDART